MGPGPVKGCPTAPVSWTLSTTRPPCWVVATHTDREAEVLALITQGRSNREIADVMYLSINTVKTYIRSAYRKIGVTGRPQAMLWGIDHGFQPDHDRIDHWRGGP